MQLRDSEYNPLPAILDMFPKRKPQPLTIAVSIKLKALLALGGVKIETDDEEIEILKLFNTLGLLDLEISTDQTTTVKVGNIYNGN